jgi:hypothetical protein
MDKRTKGNDESLLEEDADEEDTDELENDSLISHKCIYTI